MKILRQLIREYAIRNLDDEPYNMVEFVLAISELLENLPHARLEGFDVDVLLKAFSVSSSDENIANITNVVVENKLRAVHVFSPVPDEIIRHAIAKTDAPDWVKYIWKNDTVLAEYMN